MGRAAAAVPDPEKEDTDASWAGLPFTEGGAAEENGRNGAIGMGMRPE